MNRSKMLKRTTRSNFFLKVLAGLFVIVIVGALVTLVIYKQQIKSVGSSNQAIVVEILPGSDSSNIAKQLKDHKLIKSEPAFLWYLRLNRNPDLKAGTYRLSNDMSVASITKILQEGRVASDLFTIFPAQRIDQIKAAFLEAGFRQDLINTALDPKLYASHPAFAGIEMPSSLEGFLYPESFFRSSDVTPQTIVGQSLDEMAKALTPDIKAGFAAQGLTTYQGVILASIVEQEASNTADAAQIAQVFLLRIQRNMALGSDVTAFYGSRLAGQGDSVFYDSPYNTRLHPGLPPTPIGNTNSWALKAVANPAPGDYLFFVAGDDGDNKGKVFFSHTVAEHEALTKKYCLHLCN